MQLEERKRAVEDAALGIRRKIIRSTHLAGSGHPGGSLSSADVIAALYFDQMQVDPADPKWPDRDRFVLSKGHAAPALYGALAMKGFFPESELDSLRKFGAMLQGHPDAKKTPGIDASTGSLGQGFSIAVGMALAGKLEEKKYRVFTLLGDGEVDEGLVWEAAMCSVHYKLDNLIAFVDRNHLQIDGTTEEVMNTGDIGEKFAAFGFSVQYIQGHDCGAILEAVDRAKHEKGSPSMIVLETIKGKGVSFMENDGAWHGMAPNADDYQKAMAELGGTK